MILYHITKKKWLPSIMIEGLKPGYRRGIRCGKNKCKTVFLTNNINKIIEEQCGLSYVNKHDLVVLHIDCSNIKLESTKYRDGATYTLSNFEFETNKIEPNKIIKVEKLEYKKGEI